MSGVGETSAIVDLKTVAAQLSQAVIDIAGRYKNAKAQIETFGREVRVLGDILDQFHRLLSKAGSRIDGNARSVTVSIVNQCTNLFSELDIYRDSLYSRPGSVRNLAFNGKGRWVFQASELRYLRARVESIKISILLMMTLESCSNSRRLSTDPLLKEHARQIQLLSSASNGCIQQLVALEEEAISPANGDNAAIFRMSIRSINSASSARSIRESILSLWSYDSEVEKILLSHEENHSVGSEERIDCSSASRLIEECLSPAAAESECGDDETAKSWSTNDDSGYASGEHLSAPSSANPVHNSTHPSFSPGSYVPDFPTNTECDDSSHQGRRSDSVPRSPPNDLSHIGSVKAGSGSTEVSKFEPFRVGVEDLCSKVLSDALNKYDVQDDSRLWCLWLIDGDQERCLGLNERPLTIFRALKKEGRKLGFIIRRCALPVETQLPTNDSFPPPSPIQLLPKGSFSRPNVQ
ncbi:Adaptor for signal transduction [Pseudocyphellaria aurata]|nr:Adaptor for signal transduction [Pseudocyphellaria aurata]